MAMTQFDPWPRELPYATGVAKMDGERERERERERDRSIDQLIGGS